MAAALVGGSILSSVLNVLFDRMSSPEVVNWMRGKKLSQKLLGRLNTTLLAVEAFLNDAEQRHIKEIAVKQWLDSLKDAVFVADDLLDEVATRASMQKDRVQGNFLSRFLNLQDREIASRMEDIIDTMESIIKQKGDLGLREIPKESMSWRITTSLVDSSEVYGREKDKETIVKLLLDDDTRDGETSVIPIIGMGGIGKTTLARWVYHDEKVKRSFDFQAWVCVSEEFDVTKVTKTIIQAITRGSCETNDLDLLQHDLKEKLSSRKFLVVFDDVWNEDYDDWIRLLKPFQTRVKGSKILITTRSRKVASVVQTVQPQELSLLSHDDCWLVFSKHALLSAVSVENSTLSKIGREIVNKCNGLPLAAQTLGGLLRGNYDVRYWNHILKSEIWEFSEDRSKILPALRISYYYLPPFLKECFAYCSLYPKDYRYDKDVLILLWMAEDFLQPAGRKSLEEVGNEYFDELVSRSFLQHSEGNWFVMHDLMHDVATFYAGEFYFRAGEVRNVAEIDIKTRHLSHNARGNYPISEVLTICDRIKHTRTFLEVNLDFGFPFNMENAPSILLSQMKCLRVLSFRGFPLDSLPDSIGELLHLRYFDLSYTRIMTLPGSFNNLHNLQTLKLLGCWKLKMLPSGMQDLVNLRHLDIRDTRLKEMPKGMCQLKHLQFLSNFIVGENEANSVGELGALVNLCGSLALNKLENVVNSGAALEARMADKKNLSILELRWSEGGDVVDSQMERDILDKLCPHTNLKELTIWNYRGTKFPDWLGDSSYQHITELWLTGCRNCFTLPSLGELPSLKVLRISKFDVLEIIGAEFYKSVESSWETPFPSLESLTFEDMPCWQEWCSSELNAFPRLKCLEIHNCPMLKRDLPSLMPALEQLSIWRCEQFACSIPIAPAILKLNIEGDNKVILQEPPISVRNLEIEGNHMVQPMLKAITHNQLTCLATLSISNCSLDVSLPVSCLPSSLRSLKISHFRKLQFQMLQHQHESLDSLIISDSCDSYTSFSLDAFPNLKEFYICELENLKSLTVSRSLPSLRDLGIKDCPSFVGFSTIVTASPQLTTLRIMGCPEIECPSQGIPLKLISLSIGNHYEKVVSFLASMNSHGHSLNNLEIIGERCDSFKSFPKEACLPACLEYLSLWNIEDMETLDCKALSQLSSLSTIHICGCPKLKNMVGERLPASVRRLSIRKTPLLGKQWEMKDPQIWPKISHIRHICVNGTWIW